MEILRVKPSDSQHIKVVTKDGSLTFYSRVEGAGRRNYFQHDMQNGKAQVSNINGPRFAKLRGRINAAIIATI